MARGLRRPRCGRSTGWQVRDVLAFPALTKSDHLFYMYDPAIDCRRNGKDIPNLVGIGRIYRRQGTSRLPNSGL